MFKRLPVSVFATLLLLVAFGHAFSSAQAADDQPPKVTFASSHVSFHDVQVIPADDSHLLMFTLQFHNNEARPLYFRDYFMRLHDASGQSYTLLRQDGEAESNTIAASTTRTVRYVARIGKVKTAESLTVSYIRWNKDMPNFEQKLGQVQLQAAPLPMIEPGASAELSTNRQQWQLRIAEFRLQDTTTTSNEQPVEIQLELRHSNKQTLELPKLQYELATAEGLRYPLTLTSVDTKTKDSLPPQEAATARLSGNLPASLPDADMYLLVSKPVQVGQFGTYMTPDTRLKLPDVAATATTAMGETLTFQGNDGPFHLIFSDLYRLPWEEQDVLSAGLTLRNASDRILPLPDLSAAFLLDGKIRVEGEWIWPQDLIALAPGEQTRLQFVAAIPYAYRFANIQIPLRVTTQIRDQAQTESITTFEHAGSFSAIPTVAAGRSHMEERFDLPLEITVDAIDLYASSRSQLFNASVQLAHLGERLSALPQMSAQLELASGVVYPLSIVRTSAKSEPGAPAVWKLQAALPKQANVKGATILLGETLLAQSGEQIMGIVNPLRLNTPSVIEEVGELLNPVEFGPYRLEISRFQTPFIYYNELTFGFDYTLTRDTLIQTDTRGESLYIEAADPTGKVWMKRTLALEEAPDGTPIEVMALGTHRVSFKDLLSDISISRNSYTVNLYHQLPSGHRKLLASQDIQWHRGTN